jgi:uncharacterized protein (UPF0335 family)
MTDTAVAAPAAPTKTEIEIIEDMMDQLIQIEKYNTILKEIKAEAKGQGYDAAILASVAKDKLNDSLDDLSEKSQAVLDLIDEVK